MTRLVARIIRLQMSARGTHAFDAWQAEGLHVLPVHYYSPVPDTRTLHERLWETPSAELPAGIEWNEQGQLALLRDVFPQFRAEYEAFPRAATGRPHEFYLNNGMFEEGYLTLQYGSGVIKWRKVAIKPL